MYSSLPQPRCPMRLWLPAPTRAADVRALLSVLAADSMEGRMAGSRGSAKAGR